MEESVNKKLIFLLRYKLNDTTLVDYKESIAKFIDKVINNEISVKLMNYIYNYLYKFSSNNIVNIQFINNKILLSEVNVTSYEKEYKYSIIESEEELSDIKRSNVVVRYNIKSNNTTIYKQVHYSLDSNIDMMILEPPAYLVKDIKDLNSYISDILNNTNYKKVSYILLKDPSLNVYETADAVRGKIKTSKTYLFKDELLDYDSSVKLDLRENVTLYAKQIVKYLKQLYQSEKDIFANKSINNYMINISDPDLISFFDNMKINSEGDFIK